MVEEYAYILENKYFYTVVYGSVMRKNPTQFIHFSICMGLPTSINIFRIDDNPSLISGHIFFSEKCCQSLRDL